MKRRKKLCQQECKVRRNESSLWIWLSVVLVLVFVVVLTSEVRGSLSDCFDATCRIVNNQGGAMGTGCCYAIGNEKVWIFTNAHVVDKKKTVACQFWMGGYQSDYAFPAKVEWKRRDDLVDVAILTIPKDYFSGYLPKAIPLAESGTAPESGEMVYSIGCAQGAWPTAFRGHVKEYRGSDMIFLPTGAGGRSGAAIFDSAGERIVGLLYARAKDDSFGVAVSLASMRKALAWDKKSHTETQCPGGDCPMHGIGSGGRTWPGFKTPQPKRQPFQPKRPEQGERPGFRIFQPGEERKSPYPGLLPRREKGGPLERSPVVLPGEGPIVPPTPIPFSPEDDLPPAPPVEDFVPSPDFAVPKLPDDYRLKGIVEGVVLPLPDLAPLEETVDSLRDRLEAAENRLKAAEGSVEGIAQTATDRAVEAAGKVAGEVEGKLGGRIDQVTETIDGVTEMVDGVTETVQTASENATEAIGLVNRIKARIDQVEARIVRIWGWITNLSWPVFGAIALALFLLWRRIENKPKSGPPSDGMEPIPPRPTS